MGTDVHLHNCIRYLIVTASNVLYFYGYESVYDKFLKAISSNFDTLVNSEYGIILLHAQTYFSPSYCASFTKLVTSPEWISEKINGHYRFKYRNHA